MNYNGYRSKWQDDDATIYPLKLSRKKVLIELEVDATVTDYNAHQIVLTHPSMDRALIFDVRDLEEAEEALDNLQTEVESQFELEEEQREPEPVKRTEQPRANPFPSSQFYYSSKPDPRQQARPESRPDPKTVNIPSHPQPSAQQTPQQPPPVSPVAPPARKPEFDAETNPALSIMTDISEICDLMTKISPKLFGKKP